MSGQEPYTELQLDALRELANVGSGKAASALGAMIGRSVDLSVPTATALPFSEAIDAVGPGETVVTGVVLPLRTGLEGLVLLLFDEDDEATFCRLLGVEPRTEVGLSAMAEIGNILGASYVQAIGELSGMAIEPAPPAVAVDMLAAVVASAVVPVVGDGEVALSLDTDLQIEGERCSISFLLFPTQASVAELFSRLGLTD